MKKLMKYSWIVALLVALSLAIFGCGGSSGDDDNDDDDWEYGEPFFVLHDYLDDLGLEKDDEFKMNDAGNKSKADFFGDMLSEAATGTNTTYYAKVIETAGKLGLEIFTGANGWGAGMDFKFAEFEFQAGDKFEVTGHAADAYWKFAHGDNFKNSIGSWATAADEDFDEELVMTSADVKAAKNSDPAAIRLNNKGGAPGQDVSNGTEKTIQIFTLSIYRATNAEPEPEDEGDEVEPYSVAMSDITDPKKNATALASQYGGFEIGLPAFPADFDITAYEKLTIKVKFYDYDDNELTADYGLGGWKLLANKGDNYDNKLVEGYNVGVGAISNGTGFAIELTVNPGAVVLQKSDAATSGTGVGFIELIEVIFHN